MAGKYVRVFTVEMDGVKIQCAPLTCGPTEEFLDKQEEALKEPDMEKRQELLRGLTYKFVADGLSAAGEEAWTAERVRAELDKVLVGKLRDKIMVESGLELPNPESPATA